MTEQVTPTSRSGGRVLPTPAARGRVGAIDGNVGAGLRSRAAPGSGGPAAADSRRDVPRGTRWSQAAEGRASKGVRPDVAERSAVRRRSSRRDPRPRRRTGAPEEARLRPARFVRETLRRAGFAGRRIQEDVRSGRHSRPYEEENRKELTMRNVILSWYAYAESGEAGPVRRPDTPTATLDNPTRVSELFHDARRLDRELTPQGWKHLWSRYGLEGLIDLARGGFPARDAGRRGRRGTDVRIARRRLRPGVGRIRRVRRATPHVRARPNKN